MTEPKFANAAGPAALIIMALQRAKDDAVTIDSINFFDRALTVARESGALITAEGEAVADLLDDLFAALPPPSSRKASAPWQRAVKQHHRPRYRFHPGPEGAGLGDPVSLTDTQTGETRHAQGGPAHAARGEFAKTDTGAHVTPAGIGVCGLDEAKARAFLEAGG